VDVGQHGKTSCVFDRGEHFEAPIDPGPAIRGDVGTIGFVKRRLEDEREFVPRGDLCDRACGVEGVGLTLDDVDTADQSKRRSFSDLDRSDSHFRFSTRSKRTGLGSSKEALDPNGITLGE